METSKIRLWTAALACTLLAACAGPMVVDSQVQSFSQITAAPAPATYRFERLLSQQVIQQPQLEAMADPALHQAGLRRDDANPKMAVQVSARVDRVVSPWAWGGPWGPHWGWGAGFHRRHAGFGMWSDWEEPWYHREVNVIVRDLATNKVVYETRAINEGPWGDSPRVIAALFQAAMQGFPNPPAGVRTVNVTVPG